MGDGPTLIDRSASQSTPFLREAFDVTNRANLQNLVDFGQEDIFTPDTAQINEDLRAATALANLRNRQFEEEVNPELAAARKDLEDQVLGLLEFDQNIANEFLKLGIGSSLDAGQPVLGEAGGADNAILQNIFGRNFLNQLMQNLQFVGGFLEANPEQQVTLNPGAEVEIQQDALANAIQARNLANQRLLGAGAQSGADALDFGLKVNQALTKEASNVANVKNQARGGGFFSTLAPVLGSVVGSTLGPIGAAVGSKLGQAVSGGSAPSPGQVDTAGIGGGPAATAPISTKGIFSDPNRQKALVSSFDRFKF